MTAGADVVIPHLNHRDCQFQRWVVPIALLGTYVVMASIGMTEDSITFDEMGHLIGGFSSWKERDHRLFQQNGQLPKRWATLPLLASGVRLPSTEHKDWRDSDVDRFGHQFLYEVGNDVKTIMLRSRVAMLLIGFVLGVVVFAWSNYQFGRIGGCVSLTLFTFSPAFLGHGRLVTSDVTAALTFTTALMSLWELIHKVTVGRVFLCGAACGLLLVSKMSGLMIGPIAAVLVTLRLCGGIPLHVATPFHARIVRKASQQLAYLIAVAMIVSAVAVIVVWAFYDFRFSTFREVTGGRDQFFRQESIESMTADDALGPGIRLARDWKLLPESYLFGLSHVLSHSRAHPTFMNGHYSLHGWTLFFPYAILVKTPLPVFVIVAMAIAAALGSIRNRNRSRWTIGRCARCVMHSAYRAAPLWVFLLIYWTFAVRAQLNIGDRHVLPTYPAVFILCGVAGSWIEKRHLVGRSILSIAFFWLAIASLQICPNYLSYFNQLSGGPKQGYRHLVDSSLDWGQDLGRLRHWLEHRRNQDIESPVYLAYFGSADPAFSEIRAMPLPGYLDWRSEIDFQPLQPGTYCISATILQSVYGLAFGPWNNTYEQAFQRYSKMVASYGTRVSLTRIKEGRSNERERMIYEFEQLRFARLCAHLRRREPDDQVAYSILIFEVSDDELKLATGLK